MEHSESPFPFDRKNVVSNVADDLQNIKNLKSARPETIFMKAVYKDSKAEFLAQAKRLVQVSSEPLDGATISKLLHLGCKCDSADCTSALLGRELETFSSVDELNYSLNSPLHTAAMADSARCVDVFLKKGAHTELWNCDGQLAVDLSLSDKRMGINWNPDVHSIEDLIHLMKKKVGDADIIQLLLKANADVNDADAEGNCALHWILKWSRLCPLQIK